jgi:predicted ferric reductase
MKSSSYIPENVTGQKKSSFSLYLLGGALGLALSAVALPWILPGLVQSLIGTDVKAFWYLSRGLAIMSYLMIWFSVVWGILMTTRLSRVWPGHAFTADLHKFISILGLGLATLHGLILMGDKYMNLSLAQVFIPFSVQNYRPFWVGLGQISLYLLALVVVSFYIRKALGQKLWRLIHYLSFFTFFAVLIHGLAAGSDTMTAGMFFVYYLSGTIVVFLTFYRIFTAKLFKKPETVVQNPPLLR